MPKVITNEQFCKRIKGRPLTPLDSYVGMHTKIRFKCRVDQHVWSSSPSNILSGKGCPVCGRKLISISRRKHNKILEDHGDWLVVDISTKRWPAASMTIDRCDFTKLSKIGRALMDTDYAIFRDPNLGAIVCVHSFVLGHQDGMICDHIDRNRTNNRASNLRFVTYSQNNHNRDIRERNTSGMPGVCWHKNRHKWYASIKVDRKTIHLGSFVSKKDAMDARAKAESAFKDAWGWT